MPPAPTECSKGATSAQQRVRIHLANGQDQLANHTYTSEIQAGALLPQHLRPTSDIHSNNTTHFILFFPSSSHSHNLFGRHMFLILAEQTEAKSKPNSRGASTGTLESAPYELSGPPKRIPQDQYESNISSSSAISTFSGLCRSSQSSITSTTSSLEETTAVVVARC